MWTVDSLAMPPDEGALLDLWFSVDPGLRFADNDIRLQDYETCRLQFVTDRGPYVPQVTNWSVLICEAPDCAHAGTIRRASGRRRPRSH